MKKRLLRVIETTSGSLGVDASKGIFMVSKSSMNNLESKIVIYYQDYEEIFGIDKPHMPTIQKQMCIVKVKTRNGHAIYRECIAHPLITTPCAAVTWNSLSMLNLENVKKPIVELSKSNRYAFYWHHPSHSVRVSVKLAVIGIIISIIAIIISMIVSL